jgi:hypothetical protein
MCWILRETDWSVEQTRSSEFMRTTDPKGFWRVDKEREPELRQTILGLIAFEDLKRKGLMSFLSQNNGEGWMIPEKLRLADYGLGHDDRAREYQPVASRLGPRFYDWQLSQSVEQSWEECERHAELIRQIVPLPQENKEPPQETENKKPTDLFGNPLPTDLFGNVIPPRRKR